MPDDATCTFWFKVTILNGATKDYKFIEDGPDVFRVSSVLPAANAEGLPDNQASAGYREVYLGGDASSDSSGALVKMVPTKKRNEKRDKHSL